MKSQSPDDHWQRLSAAQIKDLLDTPEWCELQDRLCAVATQRRELDRQYDALREAIDLVETEALAPRPVVYIIAPTLQPDPLANPFQKI